jgi:hypothetical protein
VKKFRAVVEVLVEANDDSDASDGIGGVLTCQLQKFMPESCLLDWQFVEHFEETDGSDFTEWCEYA